MTTHAEPLTRERILSLPAGRELDALVAERVMGYTGIRLLNDLYLFRDATAAEKKECPSRRSESVPPYSESIAAAWAVVEKMATARDYRLRLTAPGGFNDDEQGGEPIAEGEWEAVFQRPHPAGHEWAGDLDDSATAEAWGDTAPLAVSRAALLTTVDD
jgi:hypothetical protein